MILVTGATGKVGRRIVAGLLAEGVPVITGRPATSFTDWAVEHAASFR